MKVYQRGNVSSGNYVKITMDTSKLDDVLMALMSKYVTRVGILGSKTSRTAQIKGETHAQYLKRARKFIKNYEGEAGNMTNAEIGLIHEKGSFTHNIPRRSFLELPLLIKSEDLMAIRKEIWDVYKGGPETPARLRKAYKDLGMRAENIIQEAFATAGFGNWRPDYTKTFTNKKTMTSSPSHMPLIDTGQLRASISSDVVER